MGNFADIIIRMNLFKPLPFQYSFVQNRKTVQSPHSDFRKSFMGLSNDIQIYDYDFEVIQQNLMSPLTEEWVGDISHLEEEITDNDSDTSIIETSPFNNIYESVKAMKETKYFIISRIQGD